MGRQNRHLKIIKAVLPVLEAEGFKVTQFHHHSRMPKSLKGVPDLYLLNGYESFWIEIKPRYANYVRDQVSDVQWQWFHDRRGMFNRETNVTYAIVENKDELLKVVVQGVGDALSWVHNQIYIDPYHWGRYENWRRGR